MQPFSTNSMFMLLEDDILVKINKQFSIFVKNTHFPKINGPSYQIWMSNDALAMWLTGERSCMSLEDTLGHLNDPKSYKN